MISLMAGMLCPALADDPPVLQRGPYLQMAAPESMTVCWRTSVAVSSVVHYGSAPDNLTLTEEGPVAIDHAVKLTGLAPATRYYYALESGGVMISSGAANSFVTSPVHGSAVPVRFWVLGDPGTQNINQRAVRDAFGPVHAERPANLWLMLGDNAYWSAGDALYQSAVFNMYPDYLRSVPLWSCIGNHEVLEGADAEGRYAWDRIFYFPTQGECGGIASGSERYYSWDYANIHFVCLDSMTSSRAANGPMAQWLETDLSSNARPWTIAFWHHPPYSKGSHDSDNSGEVAMVEMRQNFLPILEEFGVDLVLTGHSHSYERTYLLDGHYGNSGTLTPAHKKNPGSGRADGDGAYFKQFAGAAGHQGAVYITAGSSGQVSGGALNHPAHYISLNRLGSLVVDVTGLRMDVRFLRESYTAGAAPVFDDWFSMVKGTPPPPPPMIDRGPYLQKASPGAMTVCWRTDSTTGGLVRYGTNPAQLSLVASHSGAGKDHKVRLTGLAPGTKYYYAVESAGYVLASGPSYFFTTPPASGSANPVRVWVLGDSGTQGPEQIAVRDAFTALHEQKPADLWLMLGDNAYHDGTDDEYQVAVFDMYHPWLEQVPLWSCIGNHETYGAEVNGRFAWDEIFDFPTAGECGGVASGTERYYSWNHANIHFVALDSMTVSRTANGPMAQWLRADLEANTQPWTIAFWHHPPYTKGTHDSDFEEELVEMRENILPILEDYGVDLVLGGHSHVYERSWLLDRHYGDSFSFTQAHVLDAGDGSPDGDGAYRKSGSGAEPHEGAVYIVAGSSGQSGGGLLDHPAHYRSLNLTGSLVIDVTGLRMDVRFLRGTSPGAAGPVFDDSFRIEKGGPKKPGGLAILPLTASTALLRWVDESLNEDQFDLFLAMQGQPFAAAGTHPANVTGCELAGLAPGGSYQVKVRAVNAYGSVDSMPLPFEHPAAVAPVPLVARWRFVHWGDTSAVGERGDMADADLDTVPNLLEYAFNSSPVRQESRPSHSAVLTPEGRLSITFDRIAAPELTYQVEFASAPAGPWTTALTSSGAANLAGPVSVTDPSPPSGRRFARIRVTLAP